MGAKQEKSFKIARIAIKLWFEPNIIEDQFVLNFKLNSYAKSMIEAAYTAFFSNWFRCFT